MEPGTPSGRPDRLGPQTTTCAPSTSAIASIPGAASANSVCSRCLVDQHAGCQYRRISLTVMPNCVLSAITVTSTPSPVAPVMSCQVSGALQEYGKVFDERIYQQSLDLWGVEEAPHIEGDERVVILIAAGFGVRGASSGWYMGRDGLPHEANISGIGYLGIELSIWEERWADVVLESNSVQVLAHEFGHMLHHHGGRRNDAHWVSEGVANFTEKYLDRDMTLLGRGMSRLEESEHNPRANQLNRPTRRPTSPSYVGGIYFMAYILRATRSGCPAPVCQPPATGPGRS